MAHSGAVCAVEAHKAPRRGRWHDGPKGPAFGFLNYLLGQRRLTAGSTRRRAIRAAAGVRRRWLRRLTPAAGPRTPPPPRPASDRPRPRPVVTMTRQRIPTTKSPTWPVAGSLTRSTRFLTRRHAEQQQCELRKAESTIMWIGMALRLPLIPASLRRSICTVQMTELKTDWCRVGKGVGKGAGIRASG